MIKRTIIFVLLFIGVIEAGPAKEKDVFEEYCKESGKCSGNSSSIKKNKIGISGSYNSYIMRGCESEDEKYHQLGVRMNYDMRFHKNWEFHTSSAYARTVNKTDSFSGSDSIESVYGTLGLSFWWTYLRIRGDFKLIGNLERFSYRENSNMFFWPAGSGLIEAGKMNRMWGSIGCMNHDMPYGLLQAAYNVNIMNRAELGLGWVLFKANPMIIRQMDDDLLSVFLKLRISFSDYFAVKGFLGIKPFTDIDLMFEGTFGMEFSF